MTHDPLCPCTPTGFDIPLRARDEFCLCNLIAKVRADERDRCIEIVSDTYTENWRDCGWNSAVAWSLTHLRGES